ncbi:hypothetical protein AAY80_142 [Stenotrophomonas phage vB_SmaS-DLP_6]|nr:hypothetical protein AAY80_142 [Stenotrophomonas phage vB_SmaS-DLP_6]
MVTELERHLLERGCDPSRYACSLDHEEFVVTFFLFAPGTGKWTGYQQYRPFAPKTNEAKKFGVKKPRDLRYFTHTCDDSVAVFGAETLSMYDGPVYLVEGIFDAVKLHSLGLPCLAALGNGAARRGQFSPLAHLLAVTGRKVIGVLDNDAAGLELGKLCHEVFVCTTKDPGEMTLDELKEFLFHEA